MLYERVVEVDERVRADGTVEREPDIAAVRADLNAVKADGIKAVAIVFMHAYRHADHERTVTALAREMGFSQVSVSHEVSPLIKLVGRGDTTVVDAYLSPILRRYVAQVDNDLEAKRSAARLMFMMSSGGLTAAELFQGKDAILSGPAGGVVGMAETGKQAGLNRLIGFDMERDYDYSAVRHAGDLESPEKIGHSAAQRAIARLNPRKVSTRKVPVVFDPRPAGSLVSHLASAVNGSSIARKTSFLRDKMGAKLFADGIRIIDDPIRKRGLRSHPFDGEGVAGKKLALVDDGVLRSCSQRCSPTAAGVRFA